MYKKLFPFLFLLITTGLFAETINTGVLVVGGGASGVAAAIQSSRSKVKTVLVEPGPWLGGEMTAGGNCILDANRTLTTGIWGEFRQKVRDFYKRTPGYDTSAYAQLRFEPYTGAAILKKICDTVKNLTLHLNTTVNSVKKDGNNWEAVVVINGKEVTIKAKALIDATPTADVAAAAGVRFTTGFDGQLQTGEALAPVQPLPYIEDVTWIAIVKEYDKNALNLQPIPDGYDPKLYASLKGKDIKKMLEGSRLPNNKFMLKWADNSYGVTPDDFDPRNRNNYYRKIRLRTLGLIYYIQHEMGYPTLGLDDHEFGTTDHLPYIPYIREYRRDVGLTRMGLNEIYTPYVNKLYRTSIATGDAAFGQHYDSPAAPKTNYPPLPAYVVPLGSVVVKDAVNLLVTEKGMSTTHLANASTFYPSVQMTIGQGAGAIAAWCAFFSSNGKTTKNLDVRAIQGELLDFKAVLYPMTDVLPANKYYRSLQQIVGTGLLKMVQAEPKNGARQTVFRPDSTVSTADIKPVLLEIFTRAFIWFGKNKPGEVFTVGDLLSYISDYTLTEPKTLQLTLQKQWQETYRFKQPFDTQRPVTRYEFAVLVNRYLNPFARTYDITGKLVN